MKTLIVLGFLVLASCDLPEASHKHSVNCVELDTPVNCPRLYRISDPDTGAVLYISSGSSAMVLLPKAENNTPKPEPEKR